MGRWPGRCCCRWCRRQIGGVGTTLVWLFASGLLRTWVVVRLGLLSFATALFVSGILRLIPFTLEFSRWNAAASNWSLGLLAALAVFGFYASRAGQPLFGPVLND